MTETATPPTAITGVSLENAGWTKMKVSTFSDLIGPVWEKEGEQHFAFIADTKHDNSLSRVHGGMIMTFCDDGMGVTARKPHGGVPVFTVEFSCRFIDGAKHGELVELKCEIVKATRSLIFMRGTCFVGERIIATCDGVWKAPSGAARRAPAAASGVSEPQRT